MGILEFKITFDHVVLYGVDFMEFHKSKMRELRCYYNPPHLMQRKELRPWSAQAKTLIKGALYEHYKGKHYKVLDVARHSETLEESVVYQALYGEHEIWIRPLPIFVENVFVDGKTVPRFKRLD